MHRWWDSAGITLIGKNGSGEGLTSAWTGILFCLKTRHVYVSKIDMSPQGAHNRFNGQTTLSLKNVACNRSLS